MTELRYNPLLGTWTMVAANRQARPNLRSESCPFCPGSGRVPDAYDVLAYDNDFAALSPSPEAPEQLAGGLGGPYATRPSAGKCEVILYSPDHDTSLHHLPVAHLTKLVDLWAERFDALSRDPRVRYVFPFENRGEEVGVTMHHPHGQLYAYPFVPQKIAVELEQCRAHFDVSDRCLLCDMNDEELRSRERIVAVDDHFVAYVPHFSDYPFGVFVVPRDHVPHVAALPGGLRLALAAILKRVTAGFDALFDRRFPYMMCVHQTPVNAPEWSDAARYYHLHIEFYTPLRDAGRIKFYASSEMGTWAACNPRAVEESAPLLRAAIERAQAGARQ